MPYCQILVPGEINRLRGNDRGNQTCEQDGDPKALCEIHAHFLLLSDEKLPYLFVCDKFYYGFSENTKENEFAFCDIRLHFVISDVNFFPKKALCPVSAGRGQRV